MREIDYQKRFNYFYKELTAHVELPLPIMVMCSNFLPKIPEMLADEDKQQDLLNLIQLVGWVIGYKISYEAEENVSAIE